ncbi:MAG: mannitol dehydrogenase family protein [Lachnospiraceae bacterium]
MKLDQFSMDNKTAWSEKGYALPLYDRKAVEKRTKAAPLWIHFGAGNIFRAFQANIVQNLLNEELLEKGLIVAEGFDYEIIQKLNHPHDDLSILVTLKADGSVEKTVVASVVESLCANAENHEDFSRLREIFSCASLQMISFTITEKGYLLTDGKGILLPAAAADMEHGPDKPESYLGKIVSLLYTRYLAGAAPVAMVSMDNCSHNGTRLYEAVYAFAEKWSESGLTEKGFQKYISNPSMVSFPWTMIDKITPRPDPSVKAILEKDEIEDLDFIITSKHTYAAPFVNAEECQYLVIEDSFPNGRPPLEKGGVIFTDRETVDKVEKMKVCTCLNPLHTALAVFGCVLGYDLISKEMKDDALRGLVEEIGYREGLPVVINPGILDPKQFIDTVLNVRIPNPFMPDTPQRIATDTSQKLAVRFGETIKAYLASPVLNVSDLKRIPLVFAGWLRYLIGIDDSGNPFELSPDPLLDILLPHMDGLTLGSDDNTVETIEARIKPILENEAIWGVNLYNVGLAPLVCTYFFKMLASPGAVRKTLEQA